MGLDEVSGSAASGTEPEKPGEPTAGSEAPAPAAEPAASGEAKPAEKSAPAAPKWRRDPALAMAYRKGLPIEGKVEQIIKGGYEIRIGKARGFCPHSQMELHHVDNPEQYLGSSMIFRVLQLRRGGEEAILSRRALLEEKVNDERKAVRATLIEGHLMQGHVVRVTDFGAFVDLGAGVTGLVHISEIAPGRIPKAGDVVSPGQTVQVKILKLDDATGKISLSMRQAIRDPWETAGERFKAGDVCTGTVRRVVEFGAFVDLGENLEALAPADAFAPKAGGWMEGFAPGFEGSWRIASIDTARRRIGIHPVTDESSSPAPEIEAGQRLQGTVQKVERFGVFIWLRPGVVGLMPGALTGTKKGTDLARAFPVGRQLEVEVVEVDGKRIRLAVPGAQQKQEFDAPPRRDRPRDRDRDRDRDRGRDRDRERRDAAQSAATPAAPAAPFGTSLGDALRAAMNKGGDRND